MMLVRRRIYGSRFWVEGVGLIRCRFKVWGLKLRV